jgi:hypothetical protein
MLLKTSSAHRLCAGILAALLACGLIGCGSKAAGTHHVSGEVTFDGKPVPSGLIRFTPDGSKGNSGPPGYAVIQDGKYDTSAAGGKGHVSGPMIVQIEGSDSPSGETSTDESGAEPNVKVLFSGYQTTADLPKEDSTQNFEVPAAAGKVKSQPDTVRAVRGGP